MRDGSRPERIAVPKVAELVADKIRGQIARGEFTTGECLPSETELMERFGVARPTMRGAIRILESEALISTRRGAQSGPKVLAVDASKLGRRAGLLLRRSGATYEDLYEAQSAIEPRAVALAATRRTKADLDILRGLIERAHELADPVDFGPIAAEFHLALVRASKNKTLTLMAEMLHVLALELYRDSMAAGRSIGHKVRKESIRLYERVVEKIGAQDAEGAEQLWDTERTALRDALLRLASARGIVVYHA